MNIGNITAKWAALDPRRSALVDIPTGRRISFGALDTRVRNLANALAARGLAKGERVAVLAKNSIEYFETYYACARAGLIAQPLNWRLGVPEIERILRDGDPSAIVSSAEFRAERTALQRLLDVKLWAEFGSSSDGSFEDLLRSGADHEPPASATTGNEDPALILYTGGTTGISKGALHSHKTLFMGMLNQTVAERIVPRDVYLLTGQMFHIPVALAMNYMAHGCPVVLMNFEAKQALEVIESERVSAFLGITTMLNWMMAEPAFARTDLSSLRNIQYGGGPMPATVVKAALESFPCTLIQGYGQTEGMTMTFLSQEDHAAAIAGRHTERLASCGRQGFVTTIELQDEHGRPTPRDSVTAGEICVRSEANMLGYWRKPELTAETFRNGWMRTGDVAHWDADGYVFIVDRAKDMIITGGENVYSKEVEDVISGHPDVVDVAVVGKPNEEWGETVVAHVVWREPDVISADDIKDYLSDKLARYKIPREVVFATILPRTPTGKIQKHLIRAAS